MKAYIPTINNGSGLLYGLTKQGLFEPIDKPGVEWKTRPFLHWAVDMAHNFLDKYKNLGTEDAEAAQEQWVMEHLTPPPNLLHFPYARVVSPTEIEIPN
jgi:hypothetical protein